MSDPRSELLGIIHSGGKFSSEQIQVFVKWILNFSDKEAPEDYKEYFNGCWKDIERLVDQMDTHVDELNKLLKTCIINNPDLNFDFDFLVKSLDLRISILNLYYSNTHETFKQVIVSKDNTTFKTNLIGEIENLLNQLNEEEDMKTIEKLRDRFEFLASLAN